MVFFHQNWKYLFVVKPQKGFLRQWKHVRQEKGWCFLLYSIISVATIRVNREPNMAILKWIYPLFTIVVWFSAQLPPLWRIWTSPEPNFIELLSTQICLAWSFSLDKNRITNQISIFCILLVILVFSCHLLILKITWKFGWNPVFIKEEISC